MMSNHNSNRGDNKENPKILSHTNHLMNSSLSRRDTWKRSIMTNNNNSNSNNIPSLSSSSSSSSMIPSLGGGSRRSALRSLEHNNFHANNNSNTATSSSTTHKVSLSGPSISINNRMKKSSSIASSTNSSSTQSLIHSHSSSSTSSSTSRILRYGETLDSLFCLDIIPGSCPVDHRKMCQDIVNGEKADDELSWKIVIEYAIGRVGKNEAGEYIFHEFYFKPQVFVYHLTTEVLPLSYK